MISSTLGAPLGGTTVGGQPGLESTALRLILPAKGGGGLGIYFPSRVVVAPGEPSSPVTCWAGSVATNAATTDPHIRIRLLCFIWLMSLCLVYSLSAGSLTLCGRSIALCCRGKARIRLPWRSASGF